jgi:predicted RNA-binding protein with PUA-like domain
VPPPAGQGTINVTGRVGNCCACAIPVSASTAAAINPAILTSSSPFRRPEFSGYRTPQLAQSWAASQRREPVAYWLLKTEPEEFSWDDQVKRGAKGEAWTGVRNFTARGNLKAMKKGEQAFFYHTGDEKQVVGIVEIIREAYKDPTDEKGVFYCVDTRAVKPFPTPVTLAQVKADGKLKDMALARTARLSVQPVTDAEWKYVCKMGGVKS